MVKVRLWPLGHCDGMSLYFLNYSGKLVHKKNHHIEVNHIMVIL